MNKNLMIALSALVIIGSLMIFNGNSTNNLNENIMQEDQNKEEIMNEDKNDSVVEETNTPIVNNEKESDIVLIKLDTSYGEISLEMYPDKAPKTVSNFVNLAKQGFYDETKFHRVIKDFMIQGGDPLSKDESQRSYWGTGGPGYSFEDEQNDLALVSGVIAMANSGPNTNGSQFFIITAEATPWLQGKHTGFGKVVSGMNVVEKIQNTEVGPTDQPIEDVEIISVEIL